MGRRRRDKLGIDYIMGKPSGLHMPSNKLIHVPHSS